MCPALSRTPLPWNVESAATIRAAIAARTNGQPLVLNFPGSYFRQSQGPRFFIARPHVVRSAISLRIFFLFSDSSAFLAELLAPEKRSLKRRPASPLSRVLFLYFVLFQNNNCTRDLLILEIAFCRASARTEDSRQFRGTLIK